MRIEIDVVKDNDGENVFCINHDDGSVLFSPLRYEYFFELLQSINKETPSYDNVTGTIEVFSAKKSVAVINMAYLNKPEDAGCFRVTKQSEGASLKHDFTPRASSLIPSSFKVGDRLVLETDFHMEPESFVTYLLQDGSNTNSPYAYARRQPPSGGELNERVVS